MATHDKTGKGGSTGHSANGRTPYMVENTIDMSVPNRKYGEPPGGLTMF